MIKKRVIKCTECANNAVVFGELFLDLCRHCVVTETQVYPVNDWNMYKEDF